MKVFLDIDGVMVHGNPHKKVEIAEDGFYVFMTKAIEVFNQINTEEIILSTSHKNRFEIDEWTDMFKRRGLRFSKISKIMNNSLYSSRREDIENHIKTFNMNISDIIIIDDDKSLHSLNTHLKERVVITSSYRGLGDYELGIIAKIMEKAKPDNFSNKRRIKVKKQY